MQSKYQHCERRLKATTTEKENLELKIAGVERSLKTSRAEIRTAFKVREYILAAVMRRGCGTGGNGNVAWTATITFLSDWCCFVCRRRPIWLKMPFAFNSKWLAASAI